MRQKYPIEVPRQLPLNLDSSLLRGLTLTERTKAVSLLAQLLLEAAGEMDAEEDDERA